MNNLEETVLVSKDEYETLLDKVSKDNNSKGDAVTNGEDSGHGSGSGDTSAASSSVDIKRDETAMDTSQDGVKGRVISDTTTVGAESGEIDTLPSSKPSSPPPSVKDDDAAGLEEGNSQIEEEGEPEKESAQTEIESEVRDTFEGKNDKRLLNLLLSKTPSKLKLPVRLLAEYIMDNGKGIIEWNEELRLLYFKTIIPKTNFIKLLKYAFKASEKRPKGSSIFTTALESIGIANPGAWLVSQIPAKDKKKEFKSTVVVNDLPDGAASDTGSGAAISSESQQQQHHQQTQKGKKQTSKGDRFQKLSGKWVTF